MKNLVCPYTKNCQIYKNWIKQTKDNRLDIINLHKTYSCLALEALNDPETGIPMNKNLAQKIKSKNFECSHIHLLNKIKKAESKITPIY